jgi:hypothetical protein
LRRDAIPTTKFDELEDRDRLAHLIRPVLEFDLAGVAQGIELAYGMGGEIVMCASLARGTPAMNDDSPITVKSRASLPPASL